MEQQKLVPDHSGDCYDKKTDGVDKKADKKSLPLKELMTAREIRKKRSAMRRTKYYMIGRNDLWVLIYLVNDDLIKSESIDENYLPDLFIKSESLNKDFFSLYDNICYLYLKFFSGDPDLISPPKMKDLLQKESLYGLASVISDAKDSDEKSNKSDDDDLSCNMNHFKGFQGQSIEDINRYLRFLLSKDNIKELFSVGNATVFNVLDYGFFSYLLHPSIRKYTNRLIKGKYNKISDQYYMMTFIGAMHLVKFHNVGLTPNDVINIWKEKFGVEWANKSEHEIRNYIRSALAGIDNEDIIELNRTYEQE